MAPARRLGSPAIGAPLVRCWPEPEEPWAVPLGAGNLRGDFGQAGEPLTVIGKTIGHYHDAVAFAFPCPYQFGARLDPTGQFKPAVGLRHYSLHQLIEQSLRRAGKA